MKLWPECPKEHLDESFYFKNEPTAERIVGIGKFADEVGTSWLNANAYQRLLARVEYNCELALSRFPGEALENILCEIHLDFMRSIQFASSWQNPQLPMQTICQSVDIFENAYIRRDEALTQMYGEDHFFIDDGRSVSQYLNELQDKS